MKLLIINCVSDRSEAALYKGLAQRGLEIDLMSDPRDQRRAEFEAAGIGNEVLHIKGRLDLRAIKQVKAKLQSSSYDLIFAPTSRGITTTLLADLGGSLPLVTYRGTMGHLSNWSVLSRMAHLNSRVSHIVCVCDAVKDYLHSLGVPSSKLTTVYKGHDPSWYQSKAKPRSELGISEDTFVIGAVAKFRPLKGTDYLLRAVSKLKGLSQVHVLLIGENIDKRLPKLVRELKLEKQVHFLGFQENPSAFIQVCDVTTMPSLEREGVSRAVVESMALGVPVIVSDTGGLPEVVRDGQDGFVVPAGDAESIAQAVKRLIDDPELRNRFGDSALKHVSEKFSIGKYVDSVISIFERVLG